MQSAGNYTKEFDQAPPGPSAMLESLRGIGYNTPAAMADLVDNSIAAGATRVRIDFIWRGPESVIRIHDNGCGMSTEALIQAMRPAARHPSLPRSPGDLGRFGLGLKTASLSQGRIVAVASKVAGASMQARYWDLTHLEKVDEWQLLRGLPESVLNDGAIVEEFPSGTAVILTGLDRLLGAPLSADEQDRNRFRQLAARVEHHLAMTFHRFLEGSSPRLTIFVNGEDEASKVLPWDPFLSDHGATAATPVETIVHNGNGIEIQGFVLPHKDRLNSEEYQAAEGPSGWQAHEGFFVYRGHRLLVPGGWLGLGAGKGWAQNGLHRLARIRLDLPTTGDEDWKVDIRKSAAVPPLALRARLQSLAENVRRDARDVFSHRAGLGTRQQRERIVRAWLPVTTPQGTTYKIDRSHPSITQALDAVGANRRVIEEMLAVIEATVPVQRIWMDVSESADIEHAEASVVPSLEVRTSMVSLYTHMRKGLRLGADEARARILTVEPFSSYPAAVAMLPETVN